jgi:large subunit ribosomal protein L21
VRYACLAPVRLSKSGAGPLANERSELTVYAIVRAGGRQEKVAVGDLLTIDRVAGEAGSTLQLPALLLVDGETVTSDAATLAAVTVTAEVLAATKGPKITIQKFKNKTGYKKRQGYRSKLTQVKVTGIETGK